MISDFESEVPTPIITSQLTLSIKNLSRLTTAFAFIEGFLDTKHLIFYLIYNQILKVPLLVYSTTSSLIVFATTLRMIYSITSDNFSLCGSKRKSYLIVLSGIEIILYTTAIVIIEHKLNISYLITVHFLLKVTNTWRHGILCKLKSSVDSLFERTNYPSELSC